MFTKPWNPVDRKIGLGVAGCGVAIALLNSHAFVERARQFEPWWMALFAGVLVLQLVALVGGMHLPPRGLRTLWLLQPLLLFAALLLGYLAWNGHAAMPPPLQVWLFDSTIIATAVLVLRRRYVLTVTLLLAAAGPLSALIFLGSVHPMVLARAFGQAANIIYVVFVLMLREQLIRLSLARSTASQLRAEEERARGESEEFERFARSIHDEVLATFGAAVQLDGEPPLLLRQSAVTALRVLDHGPTESGSHPLELTTQQAEQLVREPIAAAAPSVTISSQISPGSVPSVAAGAIGLAAAEAARNAVRHAGGGIGTLIVGDGTIRIAIIDAGPGFDPQRIETARFGVRESIVKRVESLDGGRVSIDSSPGGTTVVMAWSRPRA